MCSKFSSLNLESSLISFVGSDFSLALLVIVNFLLKRGGGGALFEGGNYFKYFHQREAINREMAIISGSTVLQQ